MKKSNKLAALIAGVFIALPATMYICNIAGGKKEAVKVASAIGGDNSPNAITTLVMTGKKAGLGMSYASDSKGSGHIVELNIMPESLNVHGDTMMISLSDESDVYQGRVLLNGLKSVIRNGRRYLVD
ncbi:MAG: hypothetical protein J6C91_02090, partial [Muribaculaceae bacterium]|nr:hypothetical protein [Muribaculaceae bacterium]